jgi:biotin synthase
MPFLPTPLPQPTWSKVTTPLPGLETPSVPGEGVGLLDHQGIVAWLRTDDTARLRRLFDLADATRRRQVGDAVHLRGLVDISNHCVRRCHYCGLRGPNGNVNRYRMQDAEIVAAAQQAARLGYGSVVLKAGEDPAITRTRIARLIPRLQGEAGVSVTLALGERTEPELAAWREAGADRYLLRFETSNPELYTRFHPRRFPDAADRVTLLRALRALDYEVGSGVMVGLPGTTWDDLARDLLWCRDLGLDFVGVGPYVPHPETPLGRGAWRPASLEEQVPATAEVASRVLALARLLRPDANLPATNSPSVTEPDEGRRLGLQRGANVLMPNLTPAPYREHYAVYLTRRAEPVAVAHAHLLALIEDLGRTVGTGPGPAPSVLARRAAAARS